MVTIVAQLKVKPGSEAAFEEAARTMIEHVKANEPKTTTYVLHRASGNPAEFLYYEQYADMDAVAAHNASEAMKTFFRAIRDKLDGQAVISMYEVVAGKH